MQRTALLLTLSLGLAACTAARPEGGASVATSTKGQSRRFVEAARQRGNAVTFETIAGRGHFDLVNAIGKQGDPTADLVARFVLNPPTPGRD